MPSANWIEFQLSFQHWLTSPVVGLRQLVLDVAVAVEVAAVLDPGQRGAGVGLEGADQLVVAGPAVVLVQQHEEQRRGVGGSEVRGVRALAARGELAEAQLVQDLAGLLLVEVVAHRRLAGGEHAQGRRGQPGQVGQRLEARDQAVAAEQRHEPRQPGRGQRRALGEIGMDPQRGEVAEAGAVGAHERRVVRLAGPARGRATPRARPTSRRARLRQRASRLAARERELPAARRGG